MRASTDIVGFHRGERVYKPFLYADDTLIYLRDTAGSLEAVIRLIERFGNTLALLLIGTNHLYCH